VTALTDADLYACGAATLLGSREAHARGTALTAPAAHEAAARGCRTAGDDLRAPRE
jgi:hypothetical protein